MRTSVTLQEPFSYAVLPMILVGVLIIFYGIYLLISVRKKQYKKESMCQTPKKQNSGTDIYAVKSKYLTELDTIKQEVGREQITTRQAYQRMSRCIRQFVYEVTGIQVQNYTLQDIRQLHMPGLEALIAEYYAPEFAVTSSGDSTASLERTKRAIELWN